MDWELLFIPDVSIFETVLRGSVVYLTLFLLLRLVLKREAGAVGISDLLVIVLIADAAQNAMADTYRSITSGVILVATIVFWSYFLDWISYRFPKMSWIFRPPPLLIVENGQPMRRNMRKELITMEELQGELREAGVESIDQVKKMYMEGNGKFSIVTHAADRTKTKDDHATG